VTENLLRELPLQDRLSAHPFLAALPPALIEKLAHIAEPRGFRSGAYLWKQGDAAEALYLIHSGRVALEILIPHQGPLQIETVNPGEVIACSWVAELYRWHFDARAVADVSAMVLDGTTLREQCDEDPILGYAILKRLNRMLELRLQKTRLRILELHSH
jgi:CRP/FNR family transcriptional regulator, cyclic AMP receptor protein